MLTFKQATDLGKKLDTLNCTDPRSGDGLFTFVFQGEPEEQAPKYTAHMSVCEYRRVAFEIYRYKKDIAGLLNHRDGER